MIGCLYAMGQGSNWMLIREIGDKKEDRDVVGGLLLKHIDAVRDGEHSGLLHPGRAGWVFSFERGHLEASGR